MTITSKITRQVQAETSFIGYHCWPEAPKHRAYLANLHRHEFCVRVAIDVTHDDREIEFHDLYDKVKGICGMLARETSPHKKARMSCEMMSDSIIRELCISYGFERRFTVQVGEDGFKQSSIMVYAPVQYI